MRERFKNKDGYKDGEGRWAPLPSPSAGAAQGEVGTESGVEQKPKKTKVPRANQLEANPIAVCRAVHTATDRRHRAVTHKK